MSKNASTVPQRNLSKIVEGLLLIGCGWFLEVWYYYYRFTSDGTGWRVSVVIGVSLTIFLTALVRYRNKWSARIIFGLILAYSVFCTSSGQDVALSGRLNEVAREEALTAGTAEEKQRYIAEIGKIDKELQQIAGSLADINALGIQERAKWRTTIAGAEERAAFLQGEKERYDGLIAGLRGDSVQIKKISTNIYDRFGKAGAAVRIFSQVLLSLFIALMAPAGKILMEKPIVSEENKPETAPSTPNKVDNFAPYVKIWVTLSFLGDGTVIGSYFEFISEFKRKIPGKRFPEDRYKEIMDAALSSGVVTYKDGEYRQAVVNQGEAVKKIVEEIQK